MKKIYTYISFQLYAIMIHILIIIAPKTTLVKLIDKAKKFMED